MLVLDASAAVAFVLNTPPPAVSVLRERLSRPGETAHAPHLIDIEVLHVLRRHVLGRSLPAELAVAALEDFAQMSITRYPPRMMLARLWQLRENLTAYDAAYVALSEELDAPLLTLDRRLANATGHRARIELL